MGPVKPVSARTQGVGISVLHVIVATVDTANSISQVKDTTTGAYIDVPLQPLPGKSGIPKVGETWVINREYGRWSFQGLVGWTKPVITGSRGSSDAVALSLLAALKDLGLVNDQTTA